MIKIRGDRGEGAGILTNLAIEKLLEVSQNSNKICFLIDDSGKFFTLSDRFKGISICTDGTYKSKYSETTLTYKDYVEEKIHSTKLFRFVIDWKDEEKMKNIEGFAKESQEKYNLWVFVIHKSVND